MANSDFDANSNEIIWSDREHKMWFPIGFTKYWLQNNRLFISTGVFSTKEEECLLYRILDISLSRTFSQRIFGTGTIELHTKDRSNPIILLKNIGNPQETKRMFSDLIEKDRVEKGVEGADMYGSNGHFGHMDGCQGHNLN